MIINGIEIRKDITDQTFGYLRALKPVGRNKYHKTIWQFRCEAPGCGNIIERLSQDVVIGHVKSCGCLTNSFRSEAKRKDLTGQIFGYLQAVEPTGRQDNNNNCIWKCKCLQCGNNNFEATTTSLVLGNVKSCGCIKSLGELEIRELLNKNNIKYKNEYSFQDLKSNSGHKLKYDFYLPDYNRLIEFDGEQHYKHQMHGWNNKESFEKRLKNDELKNKYALENGISLVRIPYWNRGHISLEMLLGNDYLIKEVQFDATIKQ